MGRLTAFLFLTALSSCRAQVVIKQYIEGTGFNKAIQLENLGAGATDVSGYVIEERVNVPDGSVLERYTFPAGSTISTVFTVCNNQASAYMLSDVCDDTAAVGINGNDAISLLDSTGSAVDRVGEVTGTALEGTKWEVSCVAGATADHTLVRAVVSSPPLVPWATGVNQWDVYAKDTFVDSTSATWNANTGVQDTRSPVSTCTSTSPGGTVVSPPTTTTPTTTPTTPTTTPTPAPVEAPVDASTTPVPPPPPAVAYNAPAIGVEEGNDCAAPPPASADQPDRRLDTGTFRVATFNTEFLFDGVSDPSSSRWKGNPSGATEHLEKVAQFIATLEADVVNLVEVEGCSNLKSLVVYGGAAALDGAYTAYLRQGTDSATGQDVALVTRIDPSEPLTRMTGRSDYPVSGSGCGYTDTGNTGISKNYVATWDSVRIGNEQLKVAVVGLHFKAFPTDKKSCAQREGQAAVARATIQDLSSSGYEVIALGDINDFSIDPPDAASSKPTSIVLDMLTGTLPSSVSVPGISSTPRLYNVMEKMPQDQRYTAWYDKNRDNRDDGTSGGENSAIDHILVTQKLWDLVSVVDIIHEAPAGVAGEVLSDHWPLLVAFGEPGQFARAAQSDLQVNTARQSAGMHAWVWGGWSALVAICIMLVGLYYKP